MQLPASCIGDRVSCRDDISGGPQRPVVDVARMSVSVHRYFMSPPSHLLRHVGVGRRHLPQHEESRPPTEGIESVEEGHRGHRVGAVVEGKSDVPGLAYTGQIR